MRRITKIIVHCSATKENKNFKAKDIKEWHLQKGWSDIGYHFVINLDGKIETGRDLTKVGAHCKGHNSNSIGICYIGGLDQEGKAKDTRTEEQKEALTNLIKDLKELYQEATVHGHNEFSSKDCPCFDVQKEYKGL